MNEMTHLLLYLEIQIYIASWYIISNFFNFKDCLNKHGYKFKDVSKNGLFKPSEDKGILK